MIHGKVAQSPMRMTINHIVTNSNISDACRRLTYTVDMS